jgi:hypothetical protein
MEPGESIVSVGLAIIAAFAQPGQTSSHRKSVMSQGELPNDVVRFLTEKVDTVPHLEALLLLWDSRPKAWTHEEISVRVYVPPAQAQGILQDLLRQKLVVPDAEVPEGFRYDDSWDDSGLMPRVVATYRQQLVRVANLIHSKASPAVRDFARAFQFKKER